MPFKNDIARLSIGVIERTEATLLAREKLNEVLKSETWRNGHAGGNFGPAWAAFNWEIDVAELESIPLSEVKVTVFWETGDRRNSVVVSAIR